MADTFATSTPQPVQRQAVQGSNAPRIGNQGGQIQGGAVNANTQSNPGESNLPEVLTAFFEPQIAKRQNSLFIQGQISAHSQSAQQEIIKKQPSWANAFGPSYYEEGQAFYTGQDRVAKYYTQLQDQMDTLIKLSPEEVTAKMDTDLQGMLTGNESIDLTMQKGFLDQSASFMSAFTSQRRVYQQAVANKAQFDSNLSAGSLYSANERSLISVEGADADTVTAQREAGRQTLLNSLQQAPGQTEKSYLDNLGQTARAYLNNGDISAYHVLKQTEGWLRMDPDERVKIEKAEETAETKANIDLAPQFSGRILSIDAQIEQAKTYDLKTAADQAKDRAAGYVKPSPMDIINAKRAINADISRLAGTVKPYFSESDILDAGKTLITSMGESARSQIRDAKTDARQLQTEGRAQQQKELDAQLKVSSLNTAAAMGNVGTALQNGQFERSQWDALSTQMLAQGDVAGLARNYKGFAPMTAVKDSLKTMVQAGAGKGYTQNFENLLKFYGAASAQNLGMTQELFGENYEAMTQAYNAVTNSRTDPVLAWEQNFGPASKDARDAFPRLAPKQRTEVEANVTDALDKVGAGFPFRTAAKPSEDLKFYATPWITNAASQATGGRQPSDKEVAATVDRMRTSGELSVYGEYVWHQSDSNPIRLDKALGIDEKSLTVLLPQMISSAFGTALAGKFPENNITQMVQTNTPQGVVLHMLYTDPADGRTYPATLTQSQMIDFRTKKAQAQLNTDIILPDTSKLVTF